MEKFYLDRDIRVLCIRANSFPDGIVEAHEKLHNLFTLPGDRLHFGISRPERGPIIYKAAVEEKHKGEAEDLGCETMVIQKGEYLCSTISDYTQNPARITKIFQKLISEPGIDPNGYCVEWYLSGTEMRCMVRLRD